MLENFAHFCRNPLLAHKGRHCSGLTLIEFMIAVALTTIFATAIVSITVTTGRSFAEMVNYVELDQNNRSALDNLSREIRQVNFLTSYNPSRLDFIDNDGQPLTYEYSTNSRALTRTKNGSTKLVLSGCDSFQFGIFQRNPITNSYDLIPVTEPTNCKVVTATWNCSRTLFGFRANNEPAQVSRIVLRNKQQ